MEQESDILEHTDYFRQLAGIWFSRQTKREVVFPVTLSIAKSRLQIAFIETIVISNGFLSGNIKYKGQICNNEIDVQFNDPGRNKMIYSMQGELLPHPNGCYVKMTVTGKKIPLWSYFLTLIYFLAFLTVTHAGISEAIIMAIFYMLSFPIMTFSRNLAVNKLSGLLLKIIENQEKIT